MKIIVNERRSLKWKGKIYGPGDTVPNLPKTETERLLGNGALVELRPAPKEEKVKDSAPKEETADEDKGGGDDEKE